ncbi:MAG: acyl-CoA thioesterase [Proteobacteria bacterium]|nr:acyl-CoA thioesterase [Pseudomonadota bacterium]
MTRKFSVEIEVRFADLDAYGHVNNAVYLTYLETARVRSFDQNFVDFLHKGLHFVVARAECEYKKPILLNDKLIVEFEIPKFGKISFDIMYLLHNGEGLIYSKAKTTMVAVDSNTKKTMIIPTAIIDALS